jgi:hypothetical protein
LDHTHPDSQPYQAYIVSSGGIQGQLLALAWQLEFLDQQNRLPSIGFAGDAFESDAFSHRFMF